MKRTLALLAITIASLSHLASARADAGIDEVLLKNGGLARGTIVSLDPGKEVIITVLGTNQTRTIPWAEVDKVNRAGAPAAAATTPPAAPPTPPPATGYGAPIKPGSAPVVATPMLGAPRLHIDTDNGAVTLNRIDPQFAVIGANGVAAYGTTVSPLCQAPCDKVVDGRKGQEFYFGGEGVPESDLFKLTDRSGDVAVKVEVGNTAGRAAGGALSTLGVLGLLGGGVTLFVGALDSSDGDSSHSSTPVTVGAVVLAASGVALAAGIVLLVTNATKVQFNEPAQSSSAAKSRVGRFLSHLPAATF